MEGAQSMEKLIDKLCDHLNPEKIKLFIESGFDEWETVTFMKGQELPELGFNPEECIVIMVAINSQAKQNGEALIFSEETMQRVLAQAKEAEAIRHEQILKEQVEQRMKNVDVSEQPIEKHEQVRQFPEKPITEGILLKGMTLKGKEKVPLKQIHLLALQQKQLTRICEMQKVPLVQNLHLNHNHIYKIQNLDYLLKLRILKLESNEIVKMEGFYKLQALQQLFLADNHISCMEGLTNNKKLHVANLNHQRSKYSMTFEEQTCQSLAYSLETLYCDHNRVRDISHCGHLKVLNTLSLKNNLLGDMQILSEPFGGMERLKTMDFRNNPLCTLPNNSLQKSMYLSIYQEELDSKQILPKEREYLVKLYSLKHAKQMREEHKQIKNAPLKLGELQVTKLEEGTGKYSHGGDLRGNVAYANTKIHKH